jgi:hypothetical protein
MGGTFGTFAIFGIFCLLCNLTHLRRNKQDAPRIGDLRQIKVSNAVVVLLSCNSWRQAQVCMALARASDDPALKQYYEELALKFAQNAGGERDPDNTDAPLPKPDSGNTNRHRY